MNTDIPNDEKNSSSDQIKRVQKRLVREKKAREEAEKLVNDKSLELYLKVVETEDAKKQLELALWGSGESIWSWDQKNQCFDIETFSFDTHESQQLNITYQTIIERLHPAYKSELINAWHSLQNESTSTIDLQLRLKIEEEYRWFKARGRAFYKGKSQDLSVVGTIKDITSEKQQETSFKLLSYAFLHSGDPMLIVDESLNIIEANKEFYLLLAMDSNEVVNHPFTNYLTVEPSDIYSFLESKNSHMEASLNLKQNNAPIELGVSPFNDDTETQKYLIVTLRDLTDRKKVEKELNQLAHHDPLTGLLNRSALNKEIDHLLLHDSDTSFAVYFLDLDGFKGINDSMGHEAGDKMLRSISTELSKVLSSFSILSRWGGDEFIIVYPYSESSDWNAKAQLILDTVARQRVYVEDRLIEISGSVGIALYPEHGMDSETLLRHADAAMYKAKSGGKNRWQLYFAGLADIMAERVTMLAELRCALRENQLTFAIQGKYDQKRKIVGAEILCRWVSPVYGIVSPDKFIPIIEQNGLEDELGYTAIKSACAYIQALHKNGIFISISVNISPPQILQEDFIQQLIDICKTSGVAHEFIELEVTETVFVLDVALTTSRINELQHQGFKVSLDDFGTGYSALSYLRKSSFDIVKIDRSFLKDLNDDERAHNLLRAILDMCSALKSDTVVEGIETEEQFSQLKAMGVNKFQGFLLGRPVSIDNFIEQNLVRDYKQLRN